MGKKHEELVSAIEALTRAQMMQQNNQPSNGPRRATDGVFGKNNNRLVDIVIALILPILGGIGAYIDLNKNIALVLRDVEELKVKNTTEDKLYKQNEEDHDALEDKLRAIQKDVDTLYATKRSHVLDANKRLKALEHKVGIVE